MNSDVEAEEELAKAAGEVDESLLEWSLSLSDRERLRACTNAARALIRFQGDPPEDR